MPFVENVGKHLTGLPSDNRLNQEGGIHPSSCPDVYRVRQTFFSFGADCEETFNTTGEAEAYGRYIADDLAQMFFQASGDCVDVPCRSPFNAIGYSNETAFFASLFEDPDAYVNGHDNGGHFYIRGKMKWSELVDRMFEAAIRIEHLDQEAGIASLDYRNYEEEGVPESRAGWPNRRPYGMTLR